MTALDLAAARRPVQASPDAHPGDQHSLARSIALHLLPGIAGLVVFLLTAPLLAAAGWPALFAFYGPMTATIVAIEGGFLLVERRRRAAVGLPAPIMPNLHIGRSRFVLLAGGLFVLGTVATGILSVADRALIDSVFSALPTWWLISDPSQLASSPATLLAATLAVGFVMNGLLGPVVEEAYFRGYLLPRLSRYGRWAPAINSVLFSLYHFWQPWAFLSRLGYVLPYVVAVQRTGSIRLGVVVHSAANLLGLVVLVQLLSS